MSIEKADPKRPYKMYAGMVSAFFTSMLMSNILPPVGTAIACALVAALAVFITPNPTVLKHPRRRA
jgi:hypothetical protein